MSILQLMKEKNNETTGWNGAAGYESTLNKNLDLYTRAGTMRHADQHSIVNLFREAFIEDAELAVVNLFYIRDIEAGMGERRIFDLVIRYLAKHERELFVKVLPLIPVYGSFADIRKIIGNKELTSFQVQPALELVHKQLTKDFDNLLKGESISLCAKWMPSVKNKNETHKIGLSRYLKYTNMKEADYRKAISKLRKKLELVETKLTDKNYEGIDYSKVPSQAFKKYREAFYRNDGLNFAEFLEKANSGEFKVNAKTLHAYQLTERYGEVDSYFSIGTDNGVDQAIEAQWKNLPKLNNQSPNVLSMVDVSGSMTGRPMEVAVSLGIYLSENTQGIFKDHFLTFSANPTLVSLEGHKTLYDKLKTTRSAEWGMNTNLEKAFDLVLNTAVENNLDQSELPEVIFVLSDMQMDGWSSDVNKTFFNKMEKRFAEAEYKMPFLVWWNITESWDNALPVTKTDKNTATISGFSQSLFNTILDLDMEGLENYTPLSVMLNTLASERYKPIRKAMA